MRFGKKLESMKAIGEKYKGILGGKSGSGIVGEQVAEPPLLRRPVGACGWPVGRAAFVHCCIVVS